MNTNAGVLGLAAFVLMTVAGIEPADGQANRVVPTNQTVITGYGTVGYGLLTQGNNANAFNSSISPILLFQFQDRMLFEAELEFELTEGVTETGLEYAQLDFVANDHLTLVAGKFLLPFGVFGPRLHPTWINEFATAPPVYGHHVSAFGAEPLLPVLSDLGVMARAAFAPGRVQIGLSAYLVQGPSIEEGTEADPVPELVFEATSSDNNTNKMVGGRVDVGLPPGVEVNLSLVNGKYDPQNVLDFTAWNVAATLRRDNAKLRGEYIQTRQQVNAMPGFSTLVRSGFYTQASYRYGPWEPVLRWSQVFDARLNGSLESEGAWQAGVGLDYWFSPSIALMGGYEINREKGPELDNDRIVMHVAFGF